MFPPGYGTHPETVFFSQGAHSGKHSSVQIGGGAVGMAVVGSEGRRSGGRLLDCMERAGLVPDTFHLMIHQVDASRFMKS